jgi:hypothetical protein
LEINIVCRNIYIYIYTHIKEQRNLFLYIHIYIYIYIYNFLSISYLSWKTFLISLYFNVFFHRPACMQWDVNYKACVGC